LVIDFHTHTFPEKIAEAAMSSLESTGDVHRAIDGTVDALKASMDAYGINFSVNAAIATKPSQVQSINNTAISMLTDDMLIPLGAMHPDYPNDKYEELKRLRDAGIRGIKIHPEYQTTDISSPKYIEILQMCRELDLFCLAHGGRDISFPDTIMASPKALRSILPDIKGTTIIMAHMGGWRMWDEAEEYLFDTDVFIDTSFCFHTMNPEAMKKLIMRFGPNRVIFGSDSPWYCQGKSLEGIMDMDFKDDMLEKILYKNAIALLGEND